MLHILTTVYTRFLNKKNERSRRLGFIRRRFAFFFNRLAYALSIQQGSWECFFQLLFGSGRSESFFSALLSRGLPAGLGGKRRIGTRCWNKEKKIWFASFWISCGSSSFRFFWGMDLVNIREDDFDFTPGLLDSLNVLREDMAREPCGVRQLTSDLVVVSDFLLFTMKNPG